jgi:hypothetical protein
MALGFPGFDRITADPAILGGKPCIRGLRLSVQRVLEVLAQNPSWDELRLDDPELSTTPSSSPRTSGRRSRSPRPRSRTACCRCPQHDAAPAGDGERGGRRAAHDVASQAPIGHPCRMVAHVADAASPIPSAPFDDLDLDRAEDAAEWERRVMAMAAARIAAERARLERLGIIDANGDLVSRDLPPDMRAES